MDQHTNIEQYRRDPYQAYLRLKQPLVSLTRRQLTRSRGRLRREETAAKRDVPRKWALSDELIIEIF